jgi:hypothetical protein
LLGREQRGQATGRCRRFGRHRASHNRERNAHRDAPAAGVRPHRIISGYAAGGVFEWITRDLFVGDEVVLRVVESSQPDRPVRVLTDAEFDNLNDKKGLLLARGEYAALKRRMRTLEAEYGERLATDA